ncbi:MAG TPA: S53 family peptidase [Terracidiphilus sp.]|nr:S53 family peptidase [Terracidiphilus sp.]
MFHRRTFRVALAAFALVAMSSLGALAQSSHNVPRGIAYAKDLGRVAPDTGINLTVVLKMHDRAAFDRAVEELYDPDSPTFHQWFTDADFAPYAPTPQEFDTVKGELTRYGLTVISEHPQRLTLRVHGTVEQVEQAFHTEIHSFSMNGITFQAHVQDAALDGLAGELVDSVCGIERHTAIPQLSTVIDPKTGKPAVKKLVNTKASLSAFAGSLTDAPLTVSAPELFAGYGIASFFEGYQYGANGKTAAFTPLQLEAHYGVPFTQGSTKFNGAGQTIALVEAYGYAAAETDANTAATLFGLPALTTSNFAVIYPDGKPVNPNAGVLTGWYVEIALDIQTAHAIAPGAKIDVMVSAGQDNESQINTLNYIITNAIANTVSNSWENDDEIISGPLEENAFNTVLETGAAKGISFQFSSGDSGDLGLGTPVGSVGVPSNSPYATAVGGTSVLNNPYGSGQIVTGWGTNFVYLYSDGPYDPLEGFYEFGAGGGQSQYYAKPTWQKALPGTWRQVPDVSALADPYTGFPIVVTYDGEQYGEVYGGTSLASPIVSAIWAIADQFNGKALGQAAPAISALKAGDITDVVPPPSSENQYDLTGMLASSGGTTTDLNATQIFTKAVDIDDYPSLLSLYSQTEFLSAILPDAFGYSDYDVALSFGTDSSLTVTSGWDNVTGWGEPNGLPFIQGVTGKTTGAVTTKNTLDPLQPVADPIRP